MQLFNACGRKQTWSNRLTWNIQMQRMNTSWIPYYSAGLSLCSSADRIWSLLYFVPWTEKSPDIDAMKLTEKKKTIGKNSADHLLAYNRPYSKSCCMMSMVNHLWTMRRKIAMTTQLLHCNKNRHRTQSKQQHNQFLWMKILFRYLANKRFNSRSNTKRNIRIISFVDDTLINSYFINLCQWCRISKSSETINSKRNPCKIYVKFKAFPMK